jgi:hypothetical protein
MACVRGGVTRTPARRKRQADPVRPRESSFAAKHLQIAPRERERERERETSVSKKNFSLAAALPSVASLSRPDGGQRRRRVVACAASKQGTAACQRPASRAATIRRSLPAYAAGWRAPRRPAGRRGMICRLRAGLRAVACSNGDRPIDGMGSCIGLGRG